MGAVTPETCRVVLQRINICILLHLLDFYSHWIMMYGTTSLKFIVSDTESFHVAVFRLMSQTKFCTHIPLPSAVWSQWHVYLNNSGRVGELFALKQSSLFTYLTPLLFYYFPWHCHQLLGHSGRNLTQTTRFYLIPSCILLPLSHTSSWCTAQTQIPNSYDHVFWHFAS